MPTETWQDDKAGKLENKLPDIVAGVIVAGEAAFRRGLREHLERLEEIRQRDDARGEQPLGVLGQFERLHAFF